MPIKRAVTVSEVLSQQEQFSPSQFNFLFRIATDDRITYVPAQPFPEPGSSEFLREYHDILLETKAWLRQLFQYQLTSLEEYHAAKIAREVAVQLYKEQDSSYCLQGVTKVAEEVIGRLFTLLYGDDAFVQFKRFLKADKMDGWKRGDNSLSPLQAYLLRMQEQAHLLK